MEAQQSKQAVMNGRDCRDAAISQKLEHTQAKNRAELHLIRSCVDESCLHASSVQPSHHKTHYISNKRDGCGPTSTFSTTLGLPYVCVCHSQAHPLVSWLPQMVINAGWYTSCTLLRECCEMVLDGRVIGRLEPSRVIARD